MEPDFNDKCRETQKWRRHKHRGEGHAKVEAETVYRPGMPKIVGHQQTLGERRGMDPLLGSAEGTRFADTFDFGLSASGSMRNEFLLF